MAKKKALIKNQNLKNFLSDVLLALILGMIALAFFWMIGGLFVDTPVNRSGFFQPFLAISGATLPAVVMLIWKTEDPKKRVMEGCVWLTAVAIFGSLVISGRMTIPDAYREPYRAVEETSEAVSSEQD